MAERPSTLQLAAALGDSDLLAELLEQNAADTKTYLSNTTVNRCRPDNGRPPLVEAALAGDMSKVREILAAAGTHVNATSIPSGTTALHVAARMNRLEVVQQLLGHKGINVNLQSVDTHSTALHEAASYGHTAIAEALLAAPGIEVNPELRTDAATPLLVAARKGSVGVVAALLKAYGINVTAVRDPHGLRRNSIMEAITGGHAKVLTLLLSTPGIDASTPDATGATPLVQAASLGHGDCIAALLAGTPPEYRTPTDVIRALHAAVASGQRGAVECLLTAGAPVDGVGDEKPEEAPLLEAARRGTVDCIEALLAGGADVNLRSSKSGETALMLASRLGSIGSVAALLASDAIDVNAACAGGVTTGADGRSFTALHSASIRGHIDIVRILRQHPKIHAGALDAAGRTACAYAVAMGHEQCARLLRQPERRRS